MMLSCSSCVFISCWVKGSTLGWRSNCEEGLDLAPGWGMWELEEDSTEFLISLRGGGGRLGLMQPGEACWALIRGGGVEVATTVRGVTKGFGFSGGICLKMDCTGTEGALESGGRLIWGGAEEAIFKICWMSASSMADSLEMGFTTILLSGWMIKPFWKGCSERSFMFSFVGGRTENDPPIDAASRGERLSRPVLPGSWGRLLFSALSRISWTSSCVLSSCLIGLMSLVYCRPKDAMKAFWSGVSLGGVVDCGLCLSFPWSTTWVSVCSLSAESMGNALLHVSQINRWKSLMHLRKFVSHQTCKTCKNI